MGTEQQAAWTIVFALVAPRIPNLRRQIERRIPARLRNLISIDDILQEVYITVRRNTGRFPPDGDQAVDRWLAVIVTSRAADALRYARRRREWTGRSNPCWIARRVSSLSAMFNHLGVPVRTPSQVFGQTEAAERVRSAMAELNYARRTAMLMHYREGLTCSQIAQRMGRSESAVSDLLFRGRRQMHRALGSPTKYFTDARTDEWGRDCQQAPGR
jgi:RNA polymerase sigma factor (sigma-70 family)